MAEDPVLGAFARLDDVLAANIERSKAMRDRIAHIRRERGKGRAYSEIVPAEDRPLVVEMLSESARSLDSAGAHVRRSQALALYQEGVTMDQIAELFGVTRQRVSTLLKEARDS